MPIKLHRTHILLFLAGALSMYAIGHWFFLIDEYSVNILYYDQWDISNPIFYDSSFWEGFTYQHGPHRQGLGTIISKWIKSGSYWNNRTESFALGALSILTMISFLGIKYKLAKKLEWLDVVIVLFATSPFQHGVFTNSLNWSHGMLPLFFLSLLCWVILIKPKKLRLILMFVLQFCMLYTGFGMFAVPVVFIYALWQLREDKILGMLLMAGVILSVLLFGWDYNLFDVNRTQVRYDEGEPVSIFYFGLALIGKLIGGRDFTWNALLGGLTLLLIIYTIVKDKLSIRAIQKPQLVAFALIIFSLAFVLMNSYGRAVKGELASMSSRYFPLVLPLFLGLYFLNLKGGRRNNVVKIFLLIPFVVHTFYFPEEREIMERSRNGKQRWKEAYLTLHDVDKSNNKAKFAIYPSQASGKDKLDEKLDFLKENELSFFRD